MGTYTPNLLLFNPTPADPAVINTWPSIMNTGRSLTDDAVAGILTLSVAGSSNVVLTSLQGQADQARHAHFVFTGVLTGNIYVLWPAGLDRMLGVTNLTTGAFTLSIAVNDGGGLPVGTSVQVAQTSTILLMSDGTDVSIRAPSAGFYTFVGPTTSTKVFTLPNASDTIATLGTQNVFTKQQAATQTTLVDGASISWDVSTNQSAVVTLGGNRTLTNPTNAVAGATYRLKVIQDGSGTRTLTYGTAYKFPGAVTPVLTTTASGYDILWFDYDGTNMNGVIAKNFG